MSIYERLKRNKYINYYILGPNNKNWAETYRNPFYGVKQTLSVNNYKPTTIIDIRLFYITFLEGFSPKGSKPTCYKRRVYIKFKNYILVDFRLPHSVDGLYYNGLLTISFNVTNYIFPWISFNFRPHKNYYFNFGFGWEGTNENDKSKAELGLKCRIANYKNESKYNPDTVAPGYYEGHI